MPNRESGDGLETGKPWSDCKYALWQATTILLLVLCLIFIGGGVRLIGTDMTPSENCTGTPSDTINSADAGVAANAPRITSTDNAVEDTIEDVCQKEAFMKQ